MEQINTYVIQRPQPERRITERILLRLHCELLCFFNNVASSQQTASQCKVTQGPRVCRHKYSLYILIISSVLPHSSVRKQGIIYLTASSFTAVWHERSPVCMCELPILTPGGRVFGIGTSRVSGMNCLRKWKRIPNLKYLWSFSSIIIMLLFMYILKKLSCLTVP